MSSAAGPGGTSLALVKRRDIASGVKARLLSSCGRTVFLFRITRTNGRQKSQAPGVSAQTRLLVPIRYLLDEDDEPPVPLDAADPPVPPLLLVADPPPLLDLPADPDP